jgi:hypothetical protein
MTKKEFTEKIASLGITNKVFFETVGRSHLALSSVRENEKIPNSYIKLLHLFEYKLKYEELLEEFNQLKTIINKNHSIKS